MIDLCPQTCMCYILVLSALWPIVPASYPNANTVLCKKAHAWLTVRVAVFDSNVSAVRGTSLLSSCFCDKLLLATCFLTTIALDTC